MQSEFRRSRKRDPPTLADSIGETFPKHLPAVAEDKENSDSWNLRKQEPDASVMLRLRRETAKQLQDMAAEHERSLKALEQKQDKEMQALSAAFQKQLSDKDDYIRMLEQMIEGEAGVIMATAEQQQHGLNVQPTFGGRTAEFSRSRKVSSSNVAQPEEPSDVQLSNRLYLGQQLEPAVVEHQPSRCLAKRKSKSLFVAEKVSKHRITPMSKPGYPSVQP